MDNRFITAAIACVTLAMGCASAKLTVVEPLSAPVAKITLAIVDTPAISTGQAGELRSILKSRISRRDITVYPSSQSNFHDVTGDIVKYRPGNRALRYIIGFGAGRGSMDSTWTVRDASGESVGVCRIVGSIAMGIFGGNWDSVLEKVGDRLATCLSAEN